MEWTHRFDYEDVKEALRTLDAYQLADLRRIRERLEVVGPHGLSTKQSKDLGDGLFEFRLEGHETTARVFYCYIKGKTIVYLHVLKAKKTNKTPRKDLNKALNRLREVKNADAGRK